MEIMVLVCVIGVLSFWVWSLKQEIAELRGQTHAEQDEAGQQLPAPSRVARARGTDNVQTWTID